MGVSCVIQWHIDEGKSVQQSLDDLQRSFEKLGADKSGVFCVECDTYQSINGKPGKLLNVISNTEYPLSRFAHFEEGSYTTTDRMLGNFLSKLRQFWQQRKGARIECRGNRYVLSDFILKAGIVTHGTNTRGIVVEMEYTPCIYAKECWNLLSELHQSVSGAQVLTESQLFQQMKPTDIYTPECTSLQYVELFNGFRKVSS